MPFMGTWENGRLNGLNFQRQLVTEGMILTAYYDNRGILTVGCGHRVVAADGIHSGQTISQEKAGDILRKDLHTATRAVNTKIKVPLYQYEFDALVDIAFNAGGGDGFDDMAQFVNTHDYSEVPGYIQHYRDGHGNHKRRVSEAKLFKTGVYDASH